MLHRSIHISLPATQHLTLNSNFTVHILCLSGVYALYAERVLNCVNSLSHCEGNLSSPTSTSPLLWSTRPKPATVSESEYTMQALSSQIVLILLGFHWRVRRDISVCTAILYKLKAPCATHH